MVRAAVLKGKDPHQIISEMERIDQMGEDFILYILVLGNSLLFVSTLILIFKLQSSMYFSHPLLMKKY